MTRNGTTFVLNYFCNFNIFSLTEDVIMGMHFGDLGVKVRGIITYSISPHEQRAFAGTISRGIPNMGRRFFSQVFIIAPRKSFLYLYSLENSNLYF